MILNALISALIINIIVFSFCSLVAFFISFFSYKTYKLTGEKKYAYFSLGFLFLSIGLILHAVGNLSFYLGIEKCMEIRCNPPQQFLFLAHILHLILTFFAYNIIILIYFKVKEKTLIVLAFIEAFLLALLTFNSYFFNVVGFMFMAFIVYGAYRNYVKDKNKNALLALIAFILIALSHVLFIFNSMMTAYLCLFAGFLSFLLIFLKKKKV
jgi:cation transport ATPase